MKAEYPCATCAKPLSGRQRRFCSRACKNRDTNTRHQNYGAQQARGLRRKLDWIARSGGRCSLCGYARNAAALGWHHVERTTKRFNLDMRAMSNRSAAELEREIAKCVLVCANCHAELHNPALALHGP